MVAVDGLIDYGVELGIRKEKGGGLEVVGWIFFLLNTGQSGR
jgi:hypothetical protein